jgi:cobalt-zinc-cadmium efflux system membrane fusion protein
LRILGRSADQISTIESSGRNEALAYVLAPITGTVTDRQVGPGQYIQAGASTPAFSIGDLSKVWLIANVREADVSAVRAGSPVEVMVLAYPGRVFKARITQVGASIDPATRRLPARAEVDNPDGALKPEMFASFRIVTGPETAALAVPQRAVVYEGDSARVWVAVDAATLALRSIRTGRAANGMVEVVSGLSPGDKVVTSGTLFIDRAANGD